MTKIYENTSPIKVGEWPAEQGGGAYIYFTEYTDAPGLENTELRFEFESDNSFEELQELVRQLRDKGFKLVVQK